MPAEKDEDELLPCPFCGDCAGIFGDESGGFYVACFSISCHCAFGEGYDRDAMPDHSFATEELAAEAWNRRADTKEAKRKSQQEGHT
jgi:hypothetical protein